MIKTKAQLKATVRRVDEDLQQIQDYLGREHNPDGRIRFPRG
jgi:hypothetical protein